MMAPGIYDVPDPSPPVYKYRYFDVCELVTIHEISLIYFLDRLRKMSAFPPIATQLLRSHIDLDLWLELMVIFDENY